MGNAGQDEALTVAEVAQRLKLSTETVRRWLREGKLRGVRFSDAGGWRVRASEVERVLSGRPLPIDEAPKRERAA
jgi:excisionase family DNA binding protein